MAHRLAVVVSFWLVWVVPTVAADPSVARPLNNLVRELMDAEKQGLLDQRELAFTNPREGWCFFSLSGNASMTLDTEAQPLAVARGPEAVEAMRLLPAGDHVLRLSARPETLIVRAIPATVYNGYNLGISIAPFGSHSWEFLRKEILPNCNMIESEQPRPEEMAQWRSEGKHWVYWAGLPGLQVPKGDAYEYWRTTPGYADPLAVGMQVDEFYPGITPLGLQGMKRLAEDPAFRGRQWIPFLTLLGRPPVGPTVELIQRTLKAGWPLSIEVYVSECQTEAADREAIAREVIEGAGHYEREVPGCLRRAIFTLGSSSLPPCAMNVCPAADFKVHLDMQMHVLANNPLFEGLYGVQFYRSNYIDPETLRCTAQLMRHYCIEGRKDRCFSDSYELRHLRNPDFDEAVAPWELDAAEHGSIRRGSSADYGALQGRYPWDQPQGRNFLLLKRCQARRNTFGQQVADLEPGRRYSLSFITADHGDIESGQSQRATHAVSVDLDGVTLLTTASDAFQCPYHSVPNKGAFSKDHPLWFNFHWRTFVARSTTARLTISDWSDPSEPGGPIGQELIFNGIELQPCLREGKGG